MFSRGTVAVVAVALIATTPVPAYTAAVPTELPGGRPNFVVALGGFTARTSWVHLAQYAFAADGTITQTYWFWSQAGPFVGLPPVSGVRVGCNSCAVRMPSGFPATRTVSQKLTGTYATTGGTVSIQWHSGPAQSWQITEHASASRLALATSSYGATNGWGWGSTASLATAIPMSTERCPRSRRTRSAGQAG